MTTTDSARASFSLALGEDQRDLREWVHGFAAGVLRPAASERDELWGDPSGLTMPILDEELFWGDAGTRRSTRSSRARRRSGGS